MRMEQLSIRPKRCETCESKLWKMTDVLFQISSMTNPSVFNPKCLVLSLQFSTGPSKRFEGQEIVRTLSHRLPGGSGWFTSSFSKSFPLIYKDKYEVFASVAGIKLSFLFSMMILLQQHKKKASVRGKNVTLEL